MPAVQMDVLTDCDPLRPSLSELLSFLSRRPAVFGGDGLGRVPALGRGPQARALERLAVALEAQAPGTYGHSHRVAAYAAQVGKRLGMGRRQLSRIRRGGALHDIGKVEMPGHIVNKRGPLTAGEFAVVRRHATIGARMVAELGDEDLTAIVRHHHERFDGRGYPDGLAGEEIPLGARVVAVADTFDALTSTRPYRPSKGYGEALELLRAEAGAQLDPAAVEAFHQSYGSLWTR